MTNSPPPNNGQEHDLASIRAILLAQERAELARLQAEKEALAQQLLALRQELLRLEQRVQQDEEALIGRVTSKIDHILAARNRESGHEVAEAIGPVMAEAVEVQIRQDRDHMIQALNPIIIPTIGRFIRESLRELRENIEAQLRSLSGRRSLSGDEAIAQALPFAVQEIFLIQRDSGLLLAHYRADGVPDDDDSDLISGMLTAIRDFVWDSFGGAVQDGELDAIQYGEQRIVIRGGTAVYLALVVNGYEPTGTNTLLHETVSELHLQHGRTLKQYSGDPATLPPLEPTLIQLAADLTSLPTTQAQPALGTAVPRPGRLAGVWVLLGLLLLLLASSYYLLLGYRLYPVVLGLTTATPTPTVTLRPTETATAVPSPTPTLMPTATPLPTNTATPQPTATPLPTNTATPQPTATPMPTDSPLTVITSAPVWARAEPSEVAPLVQVIPADTVVIPLAQYDVWLLVTWADETGTPQQGWTPLRWLSLTGEIPPLLITPMSNN